MYRKWILCIGLTLLTVLPVVAQGPETEPVRKATDAKELSGMSIVGNDEAPKSLYIVPWKSSELGVETSLKMLAQEGEAPLDREVFARQLDYYQVRSTPLKIN
ncbi:hypothetical protein [Malonomonas rubra]|uniref:hypothetical protein n=1 Tax=Malonomonas rubra TaxID=57040 RepID=UPI0026F0964B|nr:hypothetical protein [Malonomonas rubra]